MLLIGDIHITSRMTNSIITMLRDFVDAHPQEQDIVFVGDYVYHFAYDRNALFALYEFFITLLQAGKRVYVLAGNHDRLGDSFVYAEAQKAFSVLPSKEQWSIHFITEPAVHTIDSEEVLFFPYMIHRPIDQPVIEKSSLQTQAQQSIWNQIQELSTSQHKNEQLSAYINALLLDYTLRYPKLTIIHHYYTNSIQFPGYHARFGFKDVALSEYFCDMTDIRLISGHIHAPCIYKNYLCIGSIWAASSLEHNTIRWLVRYHRGSVDFHVQLINPYWFFDHDMLAQKSWPIGLQDVQDLYASVIAAYRDEYLASDIFTLHIHQKPLPPLAAMHVQLAVDSIDYDQLATYVDDAILAECKDIKLKKHNKAVQDLLEEFAASNQKVITTFSDRKQVLKDYVQTKYPDDYVQYEEVLQELKVL